MIFENNRIFEWRSVGVQPTAGRSVYVIKGEKPPLEREDGEN